MNRRLLLRKPLFWKKLFVYFWFFSLAGHYLEVTGAYAVHLITNNVLWHPLTMTYVPLALPYGFGAVTIIILLGDSVRGHKLKAGAVFVIGMIACSVIEYACAAILVEINGYNKYWDYSERIMNINGYTCLEAGLVFGLLSLLFIYCIYPFSEKVLNNLGSRRVSMMFWLMLIIYALDLAFSYLK